MGPPWWGCDLIAASSRATEGGPDYSRVMGILLQREILRCFAVSRRDERRSQIEDLKSQRKNQEYKPQGTNHKAQRTKDKGQSTKLNARSSTLALALHALQQLVQYFN